MALAHSSTHPLVRMFGLVNRLGLLRLPPVRMGFDVAYFLYKRYLEDPFYLLTKKHPEFFQGGHILDIGANIGYTATVFAGIVNSGYRVIAFEPDTTNFKKLESATKSLQSAGKLTVLQAAVGATDGQVQLWLNQRHHADHRVVTETLRNRLEAAEETISVPLVSIDSYLNRHFQNQPVAFIKLDVQGYELCVCEGMNETLKKNPGAIVAFEHCPGSMIDLGYDPQALLTFFRDRGYTLSYLDHSGMTEDLTKERFIRLENAREYFDILAIPSART